MKQYVPNERIVDRAVELWKRMIRNPKYDALGDGPSTPSERLSMGLMAPALASMIGKPATEEQLEAFGVALKHGLMTPDEGHYENRLSVDYHPCKLLDECKTEAGITCEFPWKTNMNLYEDHLCCGCGYGAEWMQHYPLANGRWLITSLSGGDIAKIIKAVESGVDLGLTVE